ncbi:MAG TPA: c-type cytochrome [Gaiellaceae bacterium]|nr:c-type cytochrome [Gaiellaceae bacterium]
MRWSARDSAIAAAIFAGLALAAAAVAVGFAAGHYGERVKTVTVAGAAPAAQAPTPAPVDPAVAAGAHTFVQFACVQCHGPQGKGGVDPAVPELSTVGKTLTVAQLTHIINHGLGESANPKVPYMPVWGEVISKTQVANLVAYLRAGLPAVAGTQPVSVPVGQGPAVAGAALYVRYGCVNCHGPNGLGGVPNPQSPDKTIPPLSGQAFRQEFNTDAKISAVIRSGSVIGKAPIVSMPHWGGILSDAQIAQLVAYLKTLK